MLQSALIGPAVKSCDFYCDAGLAEGLQIRKGDASCNVVGIICPSMVLIWLTDVSNSGEGGGVCVLKWGFTRTFSKNQEATVKFFIFIKF